MQKRGETAEDSPLDDTLLKNPTTMSDLVIFVDYIPQITKVIWLSFHPMKHTRTHTIFHKQIGINVGIIREEKGMSQTDLALRAGIDRSYINRLENAKVNWSIDYLITVADSLDVPITRLFEGLDHCPPRDVDALDYAISGINPREDIGQ